MDCGRWLSPLLMEKRYHQPSAVVAVSTAITWIMFLEDYMVLDSLFFIAGNPGRKPVSYTHLRAHETS